MGTSARLPDSYYRALTAMADWLAWLDHSEAVHRPPTVTDSAALAGLFEALWEAAGMDASLGLTRGTPDQRMFRARLGQYFYQSPLLERCLHKPRGYAGDYLMMEGMITCPPLAATPLGAWLNSWFYDYFPPFKSVRHRKDIVVTRLIEEHDRGARSVLNVACGGVPEMALCTATFDDIALLDQDEDALAFAKSRIQGTRSGNRTRVECIHSPVWPLMKGPELLASRKFDVIYSMGLYDYLTAKRARPLTANLWRSLKPGGLLAIGNFHGHHWARYVMEAVMDWFLVYRDEEDMYQLATEAPGAEVQIETDSEGLLYFLKLRKVEEG